MKLKKLLFPATLILAFILSGTNSQAQTRNDLLFLQALDAPELLPKLPLQLNTMNEWKKTGVKKVRVQGSEDATGTFRKLSEFDEKGNLVRVEETDGPTWVLSYDDKDQLRRIRKYNGENLVSTQYIYYSRKEELRKSVLKLNDGSKELEGYYNSQNNLVMVRVFENGRQVKTTNIEYSYNDVGLITGIKSPSLKVSYLYQDGMLSQINEEMVGTKVSYSLGWGKNGLTELKKYNEKDGDLILVETVSYEYNDAGLIARKTRKPRDPNSMAEVSNIYYDSFNANGLAMRGDWDGGGYGYGTPVIIKWSDPQEDLWVTDSIHKVTMSLTAPTGQKMPDIKKMTLRLNHKQTSREIGNVVLRRKGMTEEFYIEESLPLSEGKNAIFLELETELGKFSSGERYIDYINPNKKVKVNDLYILTVGISDYENDVLDLANASGDAELIANTMLAQKGKMFGKVTIKSLTDKDATKENIEDAIRAIKSKAFPEDMVMVYFAGQGEEYNGNFYLKAYNTGDNSTTLEKSAIDNRWIMEELSRLSSPVVYFLDASHELSEGADAQPANMDEVKSDFEDVIADDLELRLFMSSTTVKQTSKMDQDGLHSVFATTIVEGINGKADEVGDKDGYVTVEELNTFVADKVLEKTNWKQKPGNAKKGIGLLPIARISDN